MSSTFPVAPKVRSVEQNAYGVRTLSFLIALDGVVYVWHRDSGRLLSALRGHESTVNMVSWSSTDAWETIASAGDDTIVRLWRPSTALTPSMLSTNTQSGAEASHAANGGNIQGSMEVDSSGGDYDDGGLLFSAM